MDKRKGIAFQNFVAQVERAFSSRDNVQIESPKFISDVDSESRREFDIFITSKFGGYHELTTAIEVREHSEPLSTPDIEAFSNKCDRNGIGRKVMVSPRGANPAAEKLAAKQGVTIMTLAQAEAFDWLAIDFFTEFRRTFRDASFHVEMPEGVPVPSGNWELLDETGSIVTADGLAAAVRDAVPPDAIDDLRVTPKLVLATFANKFVLRTSTGAVLPVAKVVGKTSYTTSVTAIPLTLHTYTGSGAGAGVDLSFATGDVRFGPASGKIMFARQADGSIDVTWQPNPEQLPKGRARRKLLAPRRSND